MNKKKLEEKELQEILELAKKVAKQSEEMCEIITTHCAKYKKWSEKSSAIAHKHK